MSELIKLWGHLQNSVRPHKGMQEMCLYVISHCLMLQAVMWITTMSHLWVRICLVMHSKNKQLPYFLAGNLRSLNIDATEICFPHCEELVSCSISHFWSLSCQLIVNFSTNSSLGSQKKTKKKLCGVSHMLLSVC